MTIITKTKEIVIIEEWKFPVTIITEVIDNGEKQTREYIIERNQNGKLQMDIKKIRELSSTRRRNLVRYYIKKRVGNLPPSKQFNEFVRQIETSITGSKTRLKIGTCVLGIQNSKLTQLSHSDV